MEWFSLKKLNKVEVKEQRRIDVSDSFAAVEDLDTGHFVGQPVSQSVLSGLDQVLI
jgi:hypothetical protein